MHVKFCIIMRLSDGPCASQRPAGWMVPEVGGGSVTPVRHLELELAADILRVATALTGRLALQWVL